MPVSGSRPLDEATDVAPPLAEKPFIVLGGPAPVISGLNLLNLDGPIESASGILLLKQIDAHDLDRVLREVSDPAVPVIDFYGNHSVRRDFIGPLLNDDSAKELRRALAPTWRRLSEIPFRSNQEDRAGLTVLRLAFSRDAAINATFVSNHELIVQYPLVGTSVGTRHQLELLADQDLLNRRHFTRTHACSKCGSARLHVYEACPKCGGADLIDEVLVHHYRCGCQEPESHFIHGLVLVCPKCHRDLRHLGVDYGKPGKIVLCRACGAVNSAPLVQFLCLDCLQVTHAETAASTDWHHYDLTANGLHSLREGRLPYFEFTPVRERKPRVYSPHEFRLLQTACQTGSAGVTAVSAVLLGHANFISEYRCGSAPSGTVGHRCRHSSRYRCHRGRGPCNRFCWHWQRHVRIHRISGDNVQGCWSYRSAHSGDLSRHRCLPSRVHHRCCRRRRDRYLVRERVRAMGALAFLQSLDGKSLILLFWYTILFEIPRYTIGAVVVHAIELWKRPEPPIQTDITLSVVLAGHNEAKFLRICVETLAEQTIHSEPGRIEVIVVDDGSTDHMFEVAKVLQREGKVDKVLRLEQRGGKSSAINCGLSVCSGDIVVLADVDTTFDRDAFAVLLGYFVDPRVGAVSGNIGVRNASASLITRYQAIEYAISISLGRCVQDSLGILAIVSGAFGAFRLTALQHVGGPDVAVGEDAVLTMKLRRAGWRIRFAPDAYALTDVPETIPALIAQRLRWDSGLVAIWMRKFRGALDPRQSTFRFIDAMVLADVIGFQVLLTLAFPIYLVWLFRYFGGLAETIIEATLIGLVVLNLLSFVAAAAVGIQTPLRLVFYLPLYVVLQLSLMRLVRVIAIGRELVFRSSDRDPFVPARVMRQVDIV